MYNNLVSPNSINFLDREKGENDETIPFKFYLLEELQPTHRPDDQGLIELTKIGLGLKIIEISRIDDSSQVLEKIMKYDYHHL